MAGRYYLKHMINHKVSNHYKQKQKIKPTITTDNDKMDASEMAMWVFGIIIVVGFVGALCVIYPVFGIIATLFGFCSGLWFLGIIFLICTLI